MSSSAWLTMGTAIGVGSRRLAWQCRDKLLAWKNRSGKQKRVSGRKGAAPRSRYATVVIIPGLCPCNAVADFAGRKILERAAPALPVPGCTEAKCQCRFQPRGDRRGDDDRRFTYGKATLAGLTTNQKNRRKQTQRRHTKRPVQARAYFNDY